MAQKIGRFVAKGVGTPDVGESRGEKKTPFIGAQFEVTDNGKNPPEYVGKTFEYMGWITDATAERVTNAYKLAGCKDPAEFDFRGFGSTEVEIDVENDGQYGPRIAFVNQVSAGGVDDRNRISGSAKDALKNRLKMMLGGARAPEQNGAAALGKSAANPFAVKRDTAEPANEGEQLAATGTEDLPF